MEAASSLTSRMILWLNDGIYAILVTIFVLAVPTFLFTTTLRAMALDEQFYLQGWERYGASMVTGISSEQLKSVARAFIDYFQAPPSRMDVQVELGGVRRPLFNQRELDHMEDVQGLMALNFRVQALSALYILAFLAVGFLLFRERLVHGLGSYLLGSTGLTVLVALLLGAVAALDFTRFWTQFHLVSFRNDFWQLDPRRDYLIMLFPEPFWMDAVFYLGRAVLIEIVGVAVAGLVLGRLLPSVLPAGGA